MAYNFGGNQGESNTFTQAITRMATMTSSKSQNLIRHSFVTDQAQGYQTVIPRYPPKPMQKYGEAIAGNVPFAGNVVISTAAIDSVTITAQPFTALDTVGRIIDRVSAIAIIQDTGTRFGQQYMELLDSTFCGAFLGFKPDLGNTPYPNQTDNIVRVMDAGAVELVASGVTPAPANITAGATAVSVLQLLRIITGKWDQLLQNGRPLVILDSNGTGGGAEGSTRQRLYSELTGGAVANNVTDIGNQLLSGDRNEVMSLLGCDIMFTNFLPSIAANATPDPNIPNSGGRTVAKANVAVKVGAAFARSNSVRDAAMTSLILMRLNTLMGLANPGYEYFINALALFGCGVSNKGNGFAINIGQL